MRKIALLVDQFYEHGGIEKLVAIKANYWVTNFKFDVTIVSTENKNRPLIYDLDKSVKFLDLHINYYRSISYFSLKNIILLLQNIIAIQRFINRNKPDVLIVASHIPITYVLPFLSRGKTKIVKEFHFSKYYDDKNVLKNKVFNYIESKYDRLVVLSDEEKSFYKSNNVVVINNPVIPNFNIDLIPSNEKELIASTILRFAPVKRIELLIEIWEIFSKKNSSWRLFVYGPLDNEYGKQIQKLVCDKKLQKCIIFKGKTNSVFEELSKSRVVLICSEQECFPMLILEAQSVGVPVVSFDCPTGPRNIINNNKDGLLVENDNVDAFVASLDTFSCDEDLQEDLSKGALTSAIKYDLHYIMNKWNENILSI